MKFIVTLSCLIGFVVNSIAQTFSLSVTTKGFSDSDIVYIKKYHGRDEITIDSIQGNRSTSTPLSSFGLYFIFYEKNASAEFIFSKENLKLEVSKNALKAGKITLTNSKENSAYERFVNCYLLYDSAFYKHCNYRPNEFEPNFIAKVTQKSNSLSIIRKSFNDSIERISKQYPNTFTTNILCKATKLPTMNNNYDYYPAFLFRHFWDSIPLNDETILNHFLLNEQLKNYFRNFVPKNEDSLKVAIDIVQEKAKENAAVLSYVNSFLLRNFLKSNAEDLALYVNKNSNTEACELNLSEAEKKKFERLKSLSVGQNVPEILLPNIENNKTSLTKSVTANKATILLFWSSHCGKCRVELPQIQALYQKYKTQGLEVFAVNIDENKFNWRDAVNEFKLDWTNVTDEGKIADSKVLEQFNIQHTPSLFLIAQNGKIFAKEIYDKALEKNVQMLLSSSNK
ncbi:MAG: AhpC/TSA family protein [Chitinophagales bacterium]|nr:AhpC/TSA family protein [Chitinophagales bacterium]